MRPFCAECHHELAAVNYQRHGVLHYRRLCNTCLRKKKKMKPQVPGWARAGYKKKAACEKCGFRSKFKEQLAVYHIDGNRHNNNVTNLKTVCLNCSVEISKLKIGWQPSDLVPDY